MAKKVLINEAVFYHPRLKHLPAEVQRQFALIENALSPENLSCDGELSVTETRKRGLKLKREWKKLCKVYDVNIKPYELGDE